MKRMAFLPIWAFVLPLIVTACGGDGGGGSATGGSTFAGVTTQARVTAANANSIFELLWNGDGLSGAIPVGRVAAKPAAFGDSGDGRHAFLGERLAERLTSTLTKLSAAARVANSAIPVEETYNGTVSGTRRTTGSIDSGTGTGSLNITYSNFNDGDGITYNGTAAAKVDGFDLSYGIAIDMTVSFTQMTIKSAGADLLFDGSLRLQMSVPNNSETLTVNLDGRDNIGNDTFRFENLVQSVVFDDMLAPTTERETYSGRIYAGKYGFVDITTGSPCIYSDPNSDNPNSGGPIILSGAGNTRAALTPLSVSYAEIEIDEDGDGVYEGKNAYAWSNLAGAPAAACISDAGPDQAVPTGTVATLDGSGSRDLNGVTLSYSWTLTEKPAGSSAVLSSTSSKTTTLTPDLAGTYAISLTVSNGTATSSPDSVSVTATGPTTGN